MASYTWPPEGGGGSGGIVSINGDTTPAQLIVGGTDISVNTVGGTTTVAYTGSPGGVTSLNGLTGALTLVATSTGTDFTISTSGSDINLNLPSASATARGLITTGAQTIAGAKNFTSVVQVPAGSVSATSIFAGTAGTGIYWPTAASRMGFASGGNLVVAIESFGLSVFAATTSNGFYFYGSGTTFFIENITNSIDALRFTSGALNNGAFHWDFTQTGTNGNTWSIYGYGGTAGAMNVGAYVMRNQASGSFIFGMTAKDAIWAGRAGTGDAVGNPSSTTFAVMARPNITNVGGTTTANASTTINHGSGTSSVANSFTRNFGVGDQISLSSAASTYATILSITDEDTLVVDLPLGNGTSQNMNRRWAIQGWLKADGTYAGMMSPDGRLGIGLVNPANLLHVDGGNATASSLQFTAGTTTGRTATDGFLIGVDSSGLGVINQQEALSIGFFTNGTKRAILQPTSLGGRLTVGDTTETVAFFNNNATKFLANGTNTTVSSTLDEIIQIGSTSAFDISPSADTNTGIGIGAYVATGFNLNLIGSNKFNAGFAVAGYPNPISAIGGFGRISADSDDTVDGAVGILCTALQTGNGATVSDLVGGVFSANTAADLGSTGSVTRATGGFFTAFTDQDSDANITTAIGGWFLEPYLVGGGSATITNKTAAYIQGTLSILEDDDSSTGNIDAFVITTSYQYMTGAAPVLRGIVPDTFNKMVIFDFANTATITNESGAVTASNAITTGTGGDLLLVKSACVVYNTTTSRWRVQWWRV